MNTNAKLPIAPPTEIPTTFPTEVMDDVVPAGKKRKETATPEQQEHDDSPIEGSSVYRERAQRTREKMGLKPSSASQRLFRSRRQGSSVTSDKESASSLPSPSVKKVKVSDHVSNTTTTTSPDPSSSSPHIVATKTVYRFLNGIPLGRPTKHVILDAPESPSTKRRLSDKPSSSGSKRGSRIKSPSSRTPDQISNDILRIRKRNRLAAMNHERGTRINQIEREVEASADDFSRKADLKRSVNCQPAGLIASQIERTQRSMDEPIVQGNVAASEGDIIEPQVKVEASVVPQASSSVVTPSPPLAGSSSCVTTASASNTTPGPSNALDTTLSSPSSSNDAVAEASGNEDDTIEVIGSRAALSPAASTSQAPQKPKKSTTTSRRAPKLKDDQVRVEMYMNTEEHGPQYLTYVGHESLSGALYQASVDAIFGQFMKGGKGRAGKKGKRPAIEA